MKWFLLVCLLCLVGCDSCPLCCCGGKPMHLTAVKLGEHQGSRLVGKIRHQARYNQKLYQCITCGKCVVIEEYIELGTIPNVTLVP